jgi:NADH-quinone oxidoreductase subunit A
LKACQPVVGCGSPDNQSLAYIWFALTADRYISGFGEVLLFIIGGAVFVIATLFISALIRPSRPNAEKLSTYESGEEPVTSAWAQFNIRFYIVALIFILFEVEIVFLFPWATIFANKDLMEKTGGAWGWFAVVEAMIFVIVLALGLVYAWVHGHLDWIKPDPDPTLHQSPVPKELYEKINRKYEKVSVDPSKTKKA